MKINTISLTDFRAFPGPTPATFDLGGNNLLVYGENGSGKSSLFHALRGFFSSSKPPDLLALRNSFSGVGIGNMRVEVGFDDSSAAAWTVVAGSMATRVPWSQPRHGPFAVPFHPGHDAPINLRVTEAAKFSAMLDYRSLLNCCVPCDHLPIRSWPLFRARDVMRGVIEAMKAEQTA